jgi:hypothetical protein
MHNASKQTIKNQTPLGIKLNIHTYEKKEKKRKILYKQSL